MIKRELWIRVENPRKMEDIQNFILSLAEEELLGDIEVILYFEKARSKCKLSHIYDVSEKAVPVLKEKYGDKNVKMSESYFQDCADTGPAPLERIADALEAISSILESIDQSLEAVSDVVGDAQVKGPHGCAIAITGIIDHV